MNEEMLIELFLLNFQKKRLKRESSQSTHAAQMQLKGKQRKQSEFFLRDLRVKENSTECKEEFSQEKWLNTGTVSKRGYLYSFPLIK